MSKGGIKLGTTYLHIIICTATMCLHVKGRDKVKDHVVALLYIDVPDTLSVVGVTGWVVGAGDKACAAVIQTPTS